MKRLRILLTIAVVAALLIGAKAWHDTMRDPVVRAITVHDAALAPGAAPIRIALLADIHVAGPDMPPSRLARIVEQVNALEPDIVTIAGDLISDKHVATRIYSPAQVVAPLAALKAPLGKVAVPGNHDHWHDWPALRDQLHAAGFITLTNEAAQIGPVAVGGLDDDFTARADVLAMSRALAPLTGPRIILSHSPDPFPTLPNRVGVMLAGHTHCGQIRYPWGGAPAFMSDYGERYACGISVENGNTLVTSAGLGTSLLPIRLFSQPEIWLIELRPPER